MRQKDSRARLTGFILRTMRTIKSHGWEEAFLERVLHIRGRELGALRTSTLLFSVSLVSFQVSTFLVMSLWSSCRGRAEGGVPSACQAAQPGSVSSPTSCLSRSRWWCLLSTHWWLRRMRWMRRRPS